MAKVKIKRKNRTHKRITTGAKILAGLGVGTAVSGIAADAVTRMVSHQQNQTDQTALNKLFGVHSAEAEENKNNLNLTGSKTVENVGSTMAVGTGIIGMGVVGGVHLFSQDENQKIANWLANGDPTSTITFYNGTSTIKNGKRVPVAVTLTQDEYINKYPEEVMLLPDPASRLDTAKQKLSNTGTAIGKGAKGVGKKLTGFFSKDGDGEGQSIDELIKWGNKGKEGTFDLTDADGNVLVEIDKSDAKELIATWKQNGWLKNPSQHLDAIAKDLEEKGYLEDSSGDRTTVDLSGVFNNNASAQSFIPINIVQSEAPDNSTPGYSLDDLPPAPTPQFFAPALNLPANTEQSTLPDLSQVSGLAPVEVTLPSQQTSPLMEQYLQNIPTPPSPGLPDSSPINTSANYAPDTYQTPSYDNQLQQNINQSDVSSQTQPTSTGFFSASDFTPGTEGIYGPGSGIDATGNAVYGNQAQGQDNGMNQFQNPFINIQQTQGDQLPQVPGYDPSTGSYNYQSNGDAVINGWETGGVTPGAGYQGPTSPVVDPSAPTPGTTNLHLSYYDNNGLNVWDESKGRYVNDLDVDRNNTVTGQVETIPLAYSDLSGSHLSLKDTQGNIGHYEGDNFITDYSYDNGIFYNNSGDKFVMDAYGNMAPVVAPTVDYANNGPLSTTPAVPNNPTPTTVTQNNQTPENNSTVNPTQISTTPAAPEQKVSYQDLGNGYAMGSDGKIYQLRNNEYEVTQMMVQDQFNSLTGKAERVIRDSSGNVTFIIDDMGVHSPNDVFAGTNTHASQNGFVSNPGGVKDLSGIHQDFQNMADYYSMNPPGYNSGSTGGGGSSKAPPPIGQDDL